MTNLFKLLFVVTLMTSVFSCGDDDTDPTSDNPFVGTWNLVELAYDTESISEVAGQTLTSTTVATTSDITYTIVFTEDMFSTSGGYTIDLSTMVAGQTIDQSVPLTDIMGSGPYSFTETTFTTESGGLFSFDVDGAANSGTTTGEPTAYEFNADGDLIINDMTTTMSTTMGIESTNTIDFNSRFVKQ